MVSNSLSLPAKIYSCLSARQGQPLSFEELFIRICPSDNKADTADENFYTKIKQQNRVTQLLVFLSDLNLIILNKFTDESRLNLLIRN